MKNQLPGTSVALGEELIAFCRGLHIKKRRRLRCSASEMETPGRLLGNGPVGGGAFIPVWRTLEAGCGELGRGAGVAPFLRERDLW